MKRETYNSRVRLYGIAIFFVQLAHGVEVRRLEFGKASVGIFGVRTFENGQRPFDVMLDLTPFRGFDRGDACKVVALDDGNLIPFHRRCVIPKTTVDPSRAEQDHPEHEASGEYKRIAPKRIG
ncbi:hypothetical protein [Methylovirgula sp. 4M-Z18]|uniref:hypothetical protein n=1 Tax=Methylovirgula sp. 4M-Z18 TaxID=2293567 RepID=UPI0018F36FE8|nr:hypothetical protein [Methylovirgula sp. 4M-Z18]